MGKHNKRRGFRHDRELAETATFGVCLMLEFDEPFVATIVQPVASAAWGVVLDGEDAAALRREAKRARQRLRASCFSGPALDFLDEVIRHTRS